MNIQNIAVLAEQLKSLGFDNLGYALLKRICFKPVSFFLLHKIDRGKDQLSFQLFFERNAMDMYVLQYYDALLQKQTLIQDSTINGINTATLEKRIADIDWKSAFDFNMKKQWSVEDKGSWDIEQKVESVIDDLLELEKVEEGKTVSNGLKLKYWRGITNRELIANISPLKNKSVVSQRFYFDEQASISVDEAYRFLQNRWLEKQIQTKRRLTDNLNIEENHNSTKDQDGPGSMEKKRHRNSAKK